MIQKEGYLQAQGQLPIVINADIGDALADVLTVVDDGEGNLVAAWAAAAAGGGLSANSIIVLQHRENQGVAGGTITGAAWNTVPFNYVLNDAVGLCSLSSNRFTLTAGTYLIFAEHTVFSASGTIPRLYNYTDSTEVFRSHQTHTSPSAYGELLHAESYATLMGVFTIGASKAIELKSMPHLSLLEFQVYATSGQATNGFGRTVDVASAPEIYGTILLIKLS